MTRSKSCGKGAFNVFQNKGKIKKEIGKINDRIRHESGLTKSMINNIDKLTTILENRKSGGVVVAATAAVEATKAFLETPPGKVVKKALTKYGPILVGKVLGALKGRHDEVQKLLDLRKALKRKENFARKTTLDVVSKVIVLNEKVGHATKDVQNNYHLGKLRAARL